MSDESIHVSYHELVTTTNKALEAVGFRRGDSGDAAETVVWQEQHGLDGIEELAKSLTYLAAEADTRLEVRYEGGCWRVFDAGGASILSVAGIVVDAAIADVERFGLAMTRIERCHNRALIGGYLNRCARRGLAGFAFWRNRRDAAEVHALCASPERDFPEMRVYASTPLDSAQQDLILMLSAHLECKPRDTAFAEAKLSRSITGAEMYSAREVSIQEGLLVNATAWQQIRAAADGVLVPEGTESRSG